MIERFHLPLHQSNVSCQTLDTPVWNSGLPQPDRGSHLPSLALAMPCQLQATALALHYLDDMLPVQKQLQWINTVDALISCT